MRGASEFNSSILCGLLSLPKSYVKKRTHAPISAPAYVTFCGQAQRGKCNVCMIIICESRECNELFSAVFLLFFLTTLDFSSAKVYLYMVAKGKVHCMRIKKVSL
jgi:hypothetical protein